MYESAIVREAIHQAKVLAAKADAFCRKMDRKLKESGEHEIVEAFDKESDDEETAEDSRGRR